MYLHWYKRVLKWGGRTLGPPGAACKPRRLTMGEGNEPHPNPNRTPGPSGCHVGCGEVGREELFVPWHNAARVKCPHGERRQIGGARGAGMNHAEHDDESELI